MGVAAGRVCRAAVGDHVVVYLADTSEVIQSQPQTSSIMPDTTSNPNATWKTPLPAKNRKERFRCRKSHSIPATPIPQNVASGPPMASANVADKVTVKVEISPGVAPFPTVTPACANRSDHGAKPIPRDRGAGRYGGEQRAVPSTVCDRCVESSPVINDHPIFANVDIFR